MNSQSIIGLDIQTVGGLCACAFIIIGCFFILKGLILWINAELDAAQYRQTYRQMSERHQRDTNFRSAATPSEGVQCGGCGQHMPHGHICEGTSCKNFLRQSK